MIKLAQEANKRVKAEADKQDSSNKSNYEQRKSKIEEQVTELGKKLQDLMKANKQKEHDQRKVHFAKGWATLIKPFLLLQRAFKQETEVENWIREYDRDMGEKQVYYFYIVHQ